MSSPWIEGLRSVALNVPDLAQAETFYTQVWNLQVAHRKIAVSRPHALTRHGQ